MVEQAWQQLEKAAPIIGKLGESRKEEGKIILRALYLTAYYEGKLDAIREEEE